MHDNGLGVTAVYKFLIISESTLDGLAIEALEIATKKACAVLVIMITERAPTMSREDDLWT